jgi:hypothetical protein
MRLTGKKQYAPDKWRFHRPNPSAHCECIAGLALIAIAVKQKSLPATDRAVMS